MAIKWTAEELAELAEFDAEIDAEINSADADYLQHAERLDVLAISEKRNISISEAEKYRKSKRKPQKYYRAYYQKNRAHLLENQRRSRAERRGQVNARQAMYEREARAKNAAEAAAFKVWMKSGGASLKSIAAALGVRPGVVSKWRTGVQRIPDDVRAKLGVADMLTAAREP